MGERGDQVLRVAESPHTPSPPQLPSPLAQGCRVHLWAGRSRRLPGRRVPGNMGEVRSPEEQWLGASSAGSVCCADVTQQTGYPEAALARVPALTVGTGRRRGGLGEQCLDGGGRGLPVGEGPLPHTTPGELFT